MQEMRLLQCNIKPPSPYPVRTRGATWNRQGLGIMKKYLPVALTLVALGTVATTPAYARTIHQPAAQSSRQFYMYAPDAVGSAAAPRSPDFTPYPSGLPVT